MARILVVDDAAIIRKLVTRMLVDGGHDVVGEAQSGAEAVEVFGLARPDLALFDINMPGGDGVSAIKEIRRGDPVTPILVCSVLTTEGALRRALQAGATAILSKPFDRERLLDAVARHLPVAA